MKHLLIAVVLGAVASLVSAADVGVSVNIGHPGFYGHIDLGGYPPPPVIYREPRMVRHVEVDQAPRYLRVPPGHRKNWRRYCGRYDACNERVYFVKDNWYRNEYAPRHRELNERNRHEQYLRLNQRPNHEQERNHDRSR